MKRKESIKTLLFGSLSVPFLKIPFTNRILSEQQNKSDSQSSPAEPMRSNWKVWPDMIWTGPEFWGNRLQDWKISGGKLECVFSGPNRNLHCLTHQLSEKFLEFTLGVEAEVIHDSNKSDDYVGFRVGARSEDEPCPVLFEDYRRTAVYGKGLDAGVTLEGRLFIGRHRASMPINLSSPVFLKLRGIPTARSYRLILAALDASNGEELGKLTVDEIGPDELIGNVALVSNIAENTERSSVRFSDWRIEGGKISANSGQIYGPVLFAQYTLHRKILKMTAQLAPVESISGHKVILQVRDGGIWKNLQETTVHPLSRTVQFRINDWPYTVDTPYRIRLELPLKERTEVFYYEGTISAEPLAANQVKAAVFSCNQDHGFPDTEVVENVSKHRPHMAMFLGDQIYEAFGGFGVERSHDLKKSTLDYLRKWYMFGWSYRDLFRHIPSVFIPDDHDVFQGNIWGQGGKAANIEDGFAAEGHDTGGFTMLSEWVKMVERTQTSHLPDPWDPTPVKQGIGVYYTEWNYAGISFAIIEDRKFKTAPANVLPPEAQVWNGFIQNPEFDITQHYDIEADLLGERQHRFLEHWVADWSDGAKIKVMLSQSPFFNLATLPKGEISDQIVPQLAIPDRGEYVTGDAPTTDMDTNGWPPKERDKAIRIIRKAFVLHVAGDQHLASVAQYGVDEFGDSGFTFTLPALNNTWPRRWWPPVADDHRPLPGRPNYTGNFKDSFGNYMTVLSVANPVKTNREPGIMYDRSTGYGIVVFDKEKRTVRLECWPRYINPQTNPEGQYDGWPVLIHQQDNYGRQPHGYLPEINVTGMNKPVIQVFSQNSDELIYALRIQGQTFKPMIFEEGLYKVRVGDPDTGQWKEFNQLNAETDVPTIDCDFT